MIGYVTVGTNDFAKASKFYDELFSVTGAKRTMEADTFIVWGHKLEEAGFSIVKPYDGKKATVGNGVMVALFAQNQEQVQALHKKAIELGGSCEGEPGLREDTFYAAYFRDLDGNKLNAFCVVPKAE